MTDKICPLFYAVSRSGDFTKCLEERCAWWVDMPHKQRCAIKDIIHKLEQVAVHD